MLSSNESKQEPLNASEYHHQETTPKVSPPPSSSNNLSVNSKPPAAAAVKNRLQGVNKSGRASGLPSQSQAGRFEYRKFKRPANHQQPSGALPTGKNHPRRNPRNGLESTKNEALKQESGMNAGVVSTETVETGQEIANQTAQGAESAIKQDKLSRPQNHRICKYFARNQSCYFGDRCRFLHIKQGQESLRSAHCHSAENSAGKHTGSQPERDAAESVESAEPQTQIPLSTILRPDCIGGESDGTRVRAESLKPESATTSASLRQQRIPFVPRLVQLKREQLGSAEQRKAFDAEVAYFKRRYPRAKVRKLTTQGAEAAEVLFEYKITDPEWVFDVDSVQLAILIPAGHPIESGFECRIGDRGRLPDPLVVHLEKALVAYFREKWATFDGQNCYELVGKALIRWLDRSIFKLFVEGLKKTKMLFDAESAGISLVVPEEAPVEPAGPSQSLDSAKRLGSVLGSEQPIDASPTLTDGVFGNSRESFEETQKIVENSDEAQSVAENVDGVNTAAAKELSETLDRMTLADNENLNGPKQDGLCEREEIRQHSTTTIDVRMQWVDCSANIASMSAVKLALSMRCAKCSTPFYVTLLANRTFSGVCQKCSNGQSVFMKSELVHENSNVLARLEPKGCRPVDCILLSSSLQFTCLNCNREASVENLSYGVAHKTWCFGCHTKCEFIISAIRFAGNFNEIVKEDASVLKIKVVKKKKPEQQLIIVDGEPLPERGTCKHYKKSYRWLRFPCCGKLYPCDVCHAENEQDHEMKFATRMVCGFCSKEQPFQMSKPCIRCSENVTRVKSAHWEGGKGCRDQKTMSRNDDRKFANSRMKTVSKKHTAQLAIKKKPVKESD